MAVHGGVLIASCGGCATYTPSAWRQMFHRGADVASRYCWFGLGIPLANQLTMVLFRSVLPP